AVGLLTDEIALGDIAKNDQSAEVRQAAAERVTTPELAKELARHAADPRVRWRAVLKLPNTTPTEKALILDIARTDTDGEVRATAVCRLRDPELLLEFLAPEKETPLRQAAIRCILDPGVLVNLAKTSPEAWVRVAAATQLT